MSLALYDIGGLRSWSQNEIELREMFQQRAVSVVKNTLVVMNKAWEFHRTEGPLLIPKTEISSAYTDKDIFVTNHIVFENTPLVLRAETTDSSYKLAKHLLTKGSRLPLCVWQSGKSFRREISDGATAAKLRFNDFWQLEFQCIYSNTTKADYRDALIIAVSNEMKRFLHTETRLVESDRLPPYSKSTLDIEVPYNDEWKEMASCSLRTDFSEDTTVCEIAIGLDRIATLANLVG